MDSAESAICAGCADPYKCFVALHILKAVAGEPGNIIDGAPAGLHQVSEMNKTLP